MNDKLTSYEDEHKACDQALWLNFEHRLTHQQFGAIKGLNGAEIDGRILKVSIAVESNAENMKSEAPKKPVKKRPMFIMMLPHVRPTKFLFNDVT